MLPGTPDPRSLTTQDPSGLTIPTAEGQPYGLDLLSSPDFASQYWQQQGVTGPEAFLYGTGQRMVDTGLNTVPLPGAGDLSAYNPATLYQSLLAQGMPDLAGGGGGASAPSGDLSAMLGPQTVAPNQPGAVPQDVYLDWLKQQQGA